jgi:hypothetical protein
VVNEGAFPAAAGPTDDLDGQSAPTGSIIETTLPNGARLLHRHDRPAARDGQTREAARVITMVWGDRYIDDLLEITIPALLAPGNLPVFAEAFACEFVVVTEIRLFDRIARSAAIAGVMQLADLRLVPIDDLLSPWYGITLTYALVRGFADLGEAMTETHLVFLNADFIVADGSYRKLVEVIQHGERLVVSPSYCMNLEHTIDVLRDRRDPLSGVLAMPPRELARLVLDNRHNTIRAKTVNQQLFRIHRYDHLYWYVDETTLIGRQMPIAVIYMRPERVLTEMPTFWDYGVISEYCPTVTPCVLGDSDDFLMAELRSEGTFRELLHLGWPTVDEIAADLSSFTTQDHRDYGRHSLILHAQDIPAGVADAKRRLAEFADSVYARMTPPIGYRDHPFWAPNFGPFTARREEAYRQHQARVQAAARLAATDPHAAARDQRIAAVRAEIVATEEAIRRSRHDIAEARQSLAAKIQVVDDELHRRRANVEAELEPALRGYEVRLGLSCQRLAGLEIEAADLERQRNDAIEAPSAEALERKRSHGPDDRPLPTALPIKDEAPAAKSASGGFVAWSARVYRSAFGTLQGTTPWHPYHSILRPLKAALAASDASDVLIVSSGGLLVSGLLRELKGGKLTITPGMLDSEFYQEALRGRAKFDLCLCDLSSDDLAEFRGLLDKLRLLLGERSRVVVFHHNLTGRSLDDRTFEFTRGLFPTVGRSQIAFTGSYPGALSMSWFARSLARHDVSRPMAILALAGTLALCAPLARLACWLEMNRPPQRLPAHCTSMTIEITLP